MNKVINKNKLINNIENIVSELRNSLEFKATILKNCLNALQKNEGTDITNEFPPGYFDYLIKKQIDYTKSYRDSLNPNNKLFSIQIRSYENETV